MKMNKGDKFHGFTITRVREVTELEGTLYEMKHEQSGAQLAWLSNKEENKLFSVAFKTTPTDDTGVFHILEHSVLCGSEKYTVKEPFVELLKSSLQTFLNAMTFPDKTMYPVSSRDEKDFQNLMKVYLDAVFAPAIYQNPNIFYQEGWHYELRDKDAAPEYKGVVFNEMKGAFSSVDRLMQSKVKAMLFPDNTYGFESGGNPECITDLTYEQFLDAHRFYYSPSNARIYLDGNLDIESTLSIIDEQYLCKFQEEKADHTIPMQNVVPANMTTDYYEIPKEEDESDKTQMAFGQIIGTWEDRKIVMATQILGEYLVGSNDAQLKKALLSSGLLQDINIQVYDGIQQPFMFTQIHNMNFEKKEELKKLISDTLELIAKEGLDVEELEAIMNQYEFQMRESQEPKGLMRNINALNAWLFEGDPLTYMTCDAIFTELRESLKTGYFEEVLKAVFLDQSNMATFFALPSKTVGKEKREKEQQKLTLRKSEWGEKELEHILSINKKLDLWQQTPDQELDIDSLPKLELSEVNREPEEKITEVIEQNGVKVLYHPSPAKGIIYLNAYFDLGNVSKEQLLQLGLLPNLLGKLPTGKYSVAKLQQAIKKDVGALNFDVKVFSTQGMTDKCRIMLTAECSVLEEKLKTAEALILEILLTTDWNATDKIAEIVMQCDQMMQQSLSMSGHSYAIKRAASHFSAEGYVKELLEGYSCYQWLHDMSQNLDSNLEKYAKEMKNITKKSCNQKSMTLSVAAYEKVPDLGGLIHGFAHGDKKAEQWVLEEGMLSTDKKEAVVIPAGISYAIMGLNLNILGKSYSGEIRVLSKILSLSYLWNEIRVQGGAYGGGFATADSGNAFYYSYRDPNAARSLGIYRKSAEFIREFCAGKEELDKYIIGSISALEPLKSTREWADSCDNDYFRGITMEDRKAEKEQMLAMTKEHLLQYCDILDEITEKGAVCVIGHEEAVKACKEEGLSCMSL